MPNGTGSSTIWTKIVGMSVTILNIMFILDTCYIYFLSTLVPV